MGEEPLESPLSIIKATEHFVVIDKPPGLLSVPGRGPEKRDSVAARAARQFPASAGPLIVHRLDMETSGLMVVALTRAAHRALSRQFEHRKTGKAYLAVLGGAVEGTWSKEDIGSSITFAADGRILFQQGTQPGSNDGVIVSDENPYKG